MDMRDLFINFVKLSPAPTYRSKKANIKKISCFHKVEQNSNNVQSTSKQIEDSKGLQSKLNLEALQSQNLLSTLQNNKQFVQ